MRKIALLIGVSEYKNFTKLPSAVNDVDALQEVLLNSEMGGFDEVKTFKNINRQDMEYEIYKLFDSRKSNELLLFYFSGHGITNPKGDLFIATPETDKNERGIVIPPTAVEASYLKKRMNDSSSNHQVIILDCCFSGAFDKELNPKYAGEAPINFKQDLGGEGRAILTSSSSAQMSYESKTSGLSIYTKYLVEGIHTGKADQDNNGVISVDELHEYASEKVQEESPEMTPRFYPVEQGYRIHIARSPQGNPKLKYRKEVEAIIQNERDEIDFIRGEIDDFEREILEIHRLEHGISIEDAKIIEKEVMELHRKRWKNLQQYKTLFSKAVKRSFPLRKNDRLNLERIQKRLSLRDEDVRRIEAKITPKISKPVTSKISKPERIKKEPQKYKRDEITRKKTKEEEEYEKWKSDKEFHQQLIKDSLLKKWM
ncbi:Clp protease [Okeania hirsuta]|uniref:Clp protease n=1 Tax=Okeania hirsuta TaxID=1458930 RepID=A0A3N6PAV6_9CYAN|nr:caspase family protein [Okeania hirsuta]RQH43304.1 Clp protease [Okeania hirsuta]